MSKNLKIEMDLIGCPLSSMRGGVGVDFVLEKIIRADFSGDMLSPLELRKLETNERCFEFFTKFYNLRRKARYEYSNVISKLCYFTVLGNVVMDFGHIDIE